MTRRLLLLSVLVAVLVAADRALQSAQAARRAESLRISAFAPDLAGSSGALAAVRIETAAGESWLYGRKHGEWRCLTWRGARADGDALLALVSSITDAVGVPLSEHPSNPTDFGLDVPSMITVSLHGPKVAPLDPGQDRLLAVDLGATLDAGAGCFARRHGERTVWSIDTAPAASLARSPGERLPPLVDRKLVPADWPDLPLRVQRMRVELAGRPPYELTLEAREVSRDEYLAGKPPFKWYLVSDGVPRDCAELLAVYFANHVVEASWTGLADPALAEHVGLDTPRAKLTLMSGEAQPIELILGAKLPGGVPAVWNSLTQQLCELQPGDEALLFPPEEAFSPEAQTNPWQR